MVIGRARSQRTPAKIASRKSRGSAGRPRILQVTAVPADENGESGAGRDPKQSSYISEFISVREISQTDCRPAGRPAGRELSGRRNIRAS